MKTDKNFKKKLIFEFEICGIVLICIFLASGCFLQNGLDAEAGLMAMILFPEETDVKTEALRLTGSYEVKGVLTNESMLHETAWGAAYVPYFELDVHEVIKIEPKEKILEPPVSIKTDYVKIEPGQVSDSIVGIYEMHPSIDSYIDKKVSMQGAVYRCGENWYICEKEETEVYCDKEGQEAYDSSHIRLKRFRTD